MAFASNNYHHQYSNKNMDLLVPLFASTTTLALGQNSGTPLKHPAEAFEKMKP